MIKTILVPTSGTPTDENVFAAALAVARPLAAHLDFYHVRLSLSEVAVRTLQFCPPAALNSAFTHIEEQNQRLSAAAIKHFADFCKANDVAVRPAPIAEAVLSAQRLEETDQAEARLLFHARHRDLVVLGRRHSHDLMPYNLMELLLMGSGRPILIAPETRPSSVTGTIVVGWKETPGAARALAAAIPLLQRAQRVVLVGIAEQHHAAPDLGHLAQQLRWHGISAETRLEDRVGAETVAVRLVATATRLAADLLVVGGYGHRPLREVVFGGVTQALIERADMPVFMVH